jgi:eukaryotic-like serine/threonine-protein kinase
LPASGEATQVISRPQATSVLPPVQEERGGSRKAWVGALLAFVVMALLAAGAYLVVTMLTEDGAGDLVAVPDVVDMTQAEAVRTLEGEGLVVDNITKDRTDRVDPGIVLEQTPLPDRQVEPGSEVDLVVSAAPRPVNVPNLDGMTLESAEASLTNAGLELGDVREENSQDVPEDRIISQSPEAFTQVPKGTPVDVIVSIGPAVVIVPDVTCDTLANAEAELRELDLTPQLGEDAPPNPECGFNPNNVVLQDTPPGTEVEPGTVIVLHQRATGAPSPSPSPSPSP